MWDRSRRQEGSALQSRAWHSLSLTFGHSSSYETWPKKKKKLKSKNIWTQTFFVPPLVTLKEGGGCRPERPHWTCYRHEALTTSGADQGRSLLYIDSSAHPWTKPRLWHAITRLLLERFSSGLKHSPSRGLLYKRTDTGSRLFSSLVSISKHFCGWQGHRSLRR